MTKLAILFVSSSGGHMSERERLIAAISPEMSSKLHILRVSDSAPLLPKSFIYPNLVDDRENIIPSVSRNILFSSFSLLFIVGAIVRSKVRLVVTTGAGIGVIACLAARVCRIPSVYIESPTRINRLALSGRAAKKISTLFLVRHANLAKELKVPCFPVDLS